MKFVIFVALIALVVAVEEKKPLPDDKKDDDNPHGLVWPMPEPYSEGDLMLHAIICYDRVEALHKQKLEEDVDKMILAHGRQYLRRVSEFFEKTADFKIMPILCRAGRNLNNTNYRWRIELPKSAAPGEKEIVQRDSPVPKEKQEKANDEIPSRNITDNETTSTASTIAHSTSLLSNFSQNLTTTVKPGEPVVETFEVRRREFYGEVGSNFARLLMREYQKQQLTSEETEFLARWVSDESVHIGAGAIYCNEGENVKEIKKQLVAFLEEKP